MSSDGFSWLAAAQLLIALLVIMAYSVALANAMKVGPTAHKDVTMTEQVGRRDAFYWMHVVFGVVMVVYTLNSIIQGEDECPPDDPAEHVRGER